MSSFIPTHVCIKEDFSHRFKVGELLREFNLSNNPFDRLMYALHPKGGVFINEKGEDQFLVPGEVALLSNNKLCD